ncbi:MAG: M3 family metallopeptidase [Prolixibacteraceae bacterium]
MKIRLLLLLFISMMLSSCNTKEKNMDNPLLKPYETPFGVPPFNAIVNEDFAPAFEEGIKQHDLEIKTIIDNSEDPTFANTILALEYSGKLIDKVQGVFGNLMGANTNDTLQAIAKDIYPKLSKHEDDILMNEQLFAKVKTVYESVNEIKLKGEELQLNKEDLKLLDETYKNFIRRGANLNGEDKEKLKAINSELSTLSLQFGENLLAEINSYQLVIDNKSDLAGLPESVISGAAEASGEDGKWVFTLHKPSWIPFLQYAQNRDLRKQLYTAMYSSGNNNNQYDNKAIVQQILKLRTERAQIMGFKNHAEFELDKRMAKKPEKVYDLLDKLWTPALKMAKREAAEMQAMIDREGNDFELESWDWWYYAEKIRKEKYALDESEIRPYFELNNVREGAFLLANKLYGLKFKEIDNIPVPHPDAKAFEVIDGDDSHVGVLFVDYFPRASKRGGAWMNSYLKQSRTIDGQNIAPIITNVCNFSKPTGDQPALLSFDEVTTLFHEFGHALHGLLSDCHYNSLSGTAVARDFVELPSQIMENWCSEPEMLRLFAKHYKTGEVIPNELIDKLLAASKFNQGFTTVEYLAACYLDMDYHTTDNVNSIDIEQFEKNSMDRIGLIGEIIPRYKSTYFNHIWASGYSAGYYSYIWAEVLDADAFNTYKESGDLFNPTIAKSFRKNILERGGTDEAMTLYHNFRGEEPAIEPLLKKRGLE